MKKRAVIFCGAFLLLAILWLGWLHIANKNLASKLAELQTRGEPILPADFAVSIPDDHNAARYFRFA